MRFARVLVGDPHRAEDVVQDALARAYPRWNRIVRVDQPDVYVRRAVVNASRSWWRRRGSHEHPVERMPDTPARPSGWWRAPSASATTRRPTTSGSRRTARWADSPRC
ncbi:sigma factor [Virgisporangium ochraceum]|uniref:sigma factor n=1 Tax=Virgisporangium ochraceum TaxID=65505 RepID=UPI0023B3118D|nr:sigma factor [Virgisporangium ochraceum]